MFGKDIGGIAHERFDPALRDLRQHVLIKGFTNDWRFVDLKVARVEHTLGRGFYQQTTALWDGVAHRHDRHGKRAAFRDRRIGANGAHDAFGQVFLGQLAGRDIRGKGPRIDRRSEAFPQKANSPHVVLVRVGDKDPFDLILTLFEPRDIRENQVDTGAPVHIGEGHTEIDNDQTFLIWCAISVDIGVHADLARAAERQVNQSFTAHVVSLL